MSISKIQGALSRRFLAPKPPHYQRRIIFWYDEAGDFQMEAETLVPEGIKFLRLGKNTFLIKKTLEHDDRESDYLIYSPAPRPGDRENYLLDVELYSESFSADRASLVMDDLGMRDFSLRDTFERHLAFFGNKQRLSAFKALGHEVLTPSDVERGMVAVLAGARTTNPEEIVGAVLRQSLHDEENKSLAEMRKMRVESAFWDLVKSLTGFQSDHPSLKTLFHSLLLTATAEQLHLDDNATGWGNYILPRQQRGRVMVFIDHWMSHTEHAKQFEAYSRAAWAELELERAAERWSLEAIASAKTFEQFDHLVLAEISRGLVAGEEAFERWEDWISERRRGYWWPVYADAYRALLAAIGLQRLRSGLQAAFRESTAKAMAEAYVEDYSRVDRLYRDFFTAHSRVKSDFLHAVADQVEGLYTNWFLPKLMDRWNTLVADELAPKWHLDGVVSQREFFERCVKETAGDRNKVYVLISDGLRYEAAVELAEELEKETRSLPELDWMLGSLPSYTRLGMASLLPPGAISWDESGDVRHNGRPTVSSGDREKILQAAFPDSIVVNYRDLMAWSKEGAREKLEGARVVYIYHNEIDMVGDKVATEQKTFEAATRTIEELKRGILKICNSLNGTYVYVTSDHGFLFQQHPLPESDKVSVERMEKVAGGKRFIVADKGFQVEGALEISLDWLVGNEARQAVYVPKGNVRFSAPGGSRYVHGGASLQEVIIPRILYTHARKTYQRAEEARRVDLELTNSDTRITSAQFTVNFFQKEPVGGKVLPRRVQVALWSMGDTEKKISTEELVVGDVDSDRPEARTLAARLHLNAEVPNGDYVLRLIDADTQMEYRRFNFSVSLAISKIAFWS